METYFFEMTDTFGGEANYAWVRRVLVRANSLRGACSKASRHFGISGRVVKVGTYGELTRWNVRNACICMFGEWADGLENFVGIETI